MPLCSRKKCISPARLVFIAIRGVGIVIFANRLFVLPSTRSIVEIRGSRSQIDLPSPFSLGQWLKYGQAQGLPLRRTLIPFASDGSWNALRVDLIQDKERRSTFPTFRKLPRLPRRNSICDLLTRHRHRIGEIRIRRISRAVVWVVASTRLITYAVSA